MRSRLQYSAVLAVAMAVLPAAASSQARVDSLMQAESAAGFSGHVWVVRDGRVVVDRAAGHADRVARTTIDSATIFSIGSVTKQFTRAAILRLEQDGRLALNDPLSRFITGLPADKAGIQLAHVLDMRAGFHEYHDDDGDHERMTKDAALRRIAAQALLFEPGSQQAYSNSGYTLLAAVIEAASGMPYEEYIRRTFIEPLGLSSTSFFGDARMPDARFARGTGERTHGDNAPNRWPPVSWVLTGAGGMVSTGPDLARWVAALRGGRVLGPAALTKMYRGQDWAAYAGGDDFGFTTSVLELRTGRDIVVVNANAGRRTRNVMIGVAQALDMELPPAMRAPRAVAQGGENVVVGGAPPTDPVSVSFRAFMAVLLEGGEAELRAAVAERFTPRMRDAFPMEQHVAILGDVARSMRESDTVTVDAPEPNVREVRITARGAVIVMRVTLEAAAPHRIDRIGVDAG